MALTQATQSLSAAERITLGGRWATRILIFKVSQTKLVNMGGVISSECTTGLKLEQLIDDLVF